MNTSTIFGDDNSAFIPFYLVALYTKNTYLQGVRNNQVLKTNLIKEKYIKQAHFQKIL